MYNTLRNRKWPSFSGGLLLGSILCALHIGSAYALYPIDARRNPVSTETGRCVCHLVNYRCETTWVSIATSWPGSIPTPPFNRRTIKAECKLPIAAVEQLATFLASVMLMLSASWLVGIEWRWRTKLRLPG